MRKLAALLVVISLVLSFFIPPLTVLAAGPYTLTMAVSPVGSGTATDDTGAPSYEGGTQVDISASPETGYHFVNWEATAGFIIGDITSSTAIFLMPADDVIVTANFAPNTYTVTFDGNDGGTPTPTSKIVTYGSTYGTLAAVTRPGYTFSGWYTKPTSGTQITSSDTVTITDNQTLYAHWTQISTYALTMEVSPGGGGKATDDTGDSPYESGTNVNISASPATGYHFVNWSAPAGSFGSSSNASTTFTMPAQAVTVTANFAPDTVTLTYTAGVNGSIAGDSPQTVNYGKDGSAVEAVPNSGYTFIDWSDGSTDNPRTDTGVTENIDVTANFGDLSAPEVTGVSSDKANGFYTDGEVIDIRVSFSEEVIVDTSGGDPYLELETGITDRDAAYFTGSGSDTLIFRYTVQDGDTSADLDYKATGSLKPNGSTIRDTNDNDAALILAVPGETGSLAANKALVIDTTDPVVTVTSPSGGETWAAGSLQGIIWEADDANMGQNPIDIEYYNGTDWVGLANGEANDGSYTWTLPVINVSTAKVRITATDKAGNSATHSSEAFSVDTTKPVITPDETSITTSDSSIRISGTITNVVTSIAKVEYLVDEGNWNNTSFKPDLSASNSVIYDFNIFLSIGQHTVEIRATDNVGNTVYAYPAITVERTSDSGEGSSLWIILGVVGVFCLMVILGGVAYFFFIREPS